MTITIPQVAQYAAYLALLIIAGGLEYFKLLPAGTVGGLFLLIVGHFFGNTPATAAIKQNTQALSENTQVTTTSASAVQGLNHLMHNTPALAPPEPQPIILQKPTS